MPNVTYVEVNGTEHTVEVTEGLSLMEGAVNNMVPGIDEDVRVRRVSLAAVKSEPSRKISVNVGDLVDVNRP